MKLSSNKLWGLAFVFSGCIFEYNPYEIRLEPALQNLNSKAIEKIKATPAKDTLTIALVADTQRFYNELERIVKSANQQQYDFMLVAGDITEYGLEQEYRWINQILEKLKQPYICVIGNHDFQGDGSHVFKKLFGPLNDSFEYGHFNFILHDTNS
ncbi:MAG: metallophosphoesterase, partial [Cyclobacteriaceae bacterium]|nr:metallophosphoesterase [Cyclobacteriaceae bacterium]